MTKERAKQLLELAYSRRGWSIPYSPDTAPVMSRGGFIYSKNPELHEHKLGMTPEEEKEIKKHWSTISGSSCFFDALHDLAKD